MRLRKIDDLSRGDHHHLNDEDECFYFFEWTRCQDLREDKVSSLIANIKKKPGLASDRELQYKEESITKCARLISQAVNTNWINDATFVPMPPSKAERHPQYDDRMERMCCQIADGIDVRTLLKQDTSIKAAHERGDKPRPTVDELKELWRVDGELTAPKPNRIVIVDDMMTVGRHYRAAHDMLSQKFQDIPITGVFVARRIFATQPPSEADPDYKVYLNTHDEEIAAEDLAEPAELEHLRACLDQQIEPLNDVVNSLANKLQGRFQDQQDRSQEFDRAEGILDVGRSPRVMANSTTSLSSNVEKDIGFRDTVVTLLLDNSGSMRGRPISIAAICADVLARTLERCNVKVEILGFTTRTWNGGQAREAWLKNGRPKLPGRLNDLRHIIYKSADAPWHRVRLNLGLMIKESLLKENIDGEALEWAYRRMLARREARKILMVISDGAPRDDSTLKENPPKYLQKHLRDVITMIEKHKKAELLAIGIGYDVTEYYGRAVKVSDVKQLASAMTEQLADLFDGDGSVV